MVEVERRPLVGPSEEFHLHHRPGRALYRKYSLPSFPSRTRIGASITTPNGAGCMVSRVLTRWWSLVAARFDHDSRWIAVGDVGIVVGVVLTGVVVHGTNPLADPVPATVTVAPFLVGWVIGAVTIGPYRAVNASSLVRSPASVALTWTVAVLIGGLLRRSALLPGDAPRTFVVVMIGSGLLGLVPWRLVVAWRRRSRSRTRSR